MKGMALWVGLQCNLLAQVFRDITADGNVWDQDARVNPMVTRVSCNVDTVDANDWPLRDQSIRYSIDAKIYRVFFIFNCFANRFLCIHFTQFANVCKKQKWQQHNEFYALARKNTR